MSTKTQRHQEYIRNSINPIFEKIIVDLLIEKPNDIVEYMISWLSTKGRKEFPPKNGSSNVSFENKRKSNKKDESDAEDDEVDDLKIPQNQQKKMSKHINAYEEESESNDEDDEDEDEIQALPSKLQQKFGKQRSSVSAEVYGKFNKKEDYKPKVVAKSELQKSRIKKRLEQAFMFSALDENEKEIVINAMDERKLEAEEFAIKQGDDGDVLYVVDSGNLDCFKRFNKEEEPRYLKTYQPGDSFGELSLLYNAPRAASIKAKTASVLFSLDRECFNHIVKDAARKKREKYEDFLSKVKLLDSMDPYERSQLSDALQSHTFKKGEHVVRQGERGDTFFMVEEGELVAQKLIDGNLKEVLQYKQGDYFGELALLKDVPRQASIVALTDVKLASMNRLSFKRMLGPLENILRRNEDRYKQFM